MPSMPKGETVGNVVIDGKGGSKDRDRQRRQQRQKQAMEAAKKQTKEVKETGRGRGSEYKEDRQR